MIDYIIDPEFKSLIHPLSDEEFNQLEDNIVKDGKLLSPIIIWSETGIIVDGHNRYEIIKRHPEITIWTNYKHFADRYEVISWICNNQLGRRNINDDQRARLIGLRYDAEKHTNGASDGFRGNQYISGAEDEPKDKVVVTKKCEVPKSTAEKLAEEYGVSKNTIINYGKFAEGVDIADSISPGISQEILSGKIKVKQKDLIALANAPVDERKQRVEWILHPEKREEHKAQSKEIHEIVADLVREKDPVNEEAILTTLLLACETFISTAEQLLRQFPALLNDSCHRGKVDDALKTVTDYIKGL